VPAFCAYVPSDIAFQELDESEQKLFQQKIRELSACSRKWEVLGMFLSFYGLQVS
jgi:hypothetical protein